MMSLIKYYLWKGKLALTTDIIKYYNQFQKCLEEGNYVHFRSQRIKELLSFSYASNPYYRELFNRHNVDFSDPGTFERIPFLTKEVIRKNENALLSKSEKKLKVFRNSSGGSTGEPVVFYQDNVYEENAKAVRYIFDEWTGYRFGMPKVVLWGSERDIFLGGEAWNVKLGRFFRNEHWVNTFKLNDQVLEKALMEIRRIKPVQVLGYAESVYELSKFMLERGERISGVRGVMTSAGTLYPFMKETIAEVFQCKVYNRYGSREVGNIASENAEQTGLIVNPFNHYVELIDQNDHVITEPGVPGEIVVTLLSNYTMPLIRYRIGDTGVWAETNNKNGLQVLKQVTGRVSDHFINRNNEKINGEYFTHLLYYRRWLKKFQIIQETREKILIKIIRNPDYAVNEQDIEDIRRKIQLVISSDCSVEFEYVDQIDPSKSGKFRYTISKINEKQ